MEAEIGAMWLVTNKEAKKTPEANRSWERQETAPLETLEEVCSYTVILDFWLPDLSENTFLLFYAIKFVVICYSNHRKLIYPLKYCNKLPTVFSEFLKCNQCSLF